MGCLFFAIFCRIFGMSSRKSRHVQHVYCRLTLEWARYACALGEARRPGDVKQMKFKILPMAVALLLGATMATTASACQRTIVSGSSAELPLDGTYNPTRLDQAILAEVNFQRCLIKRRPLQLQAELRQPARAHSDWMARNQRLSHKSAVSGRRTLSDRVRASGVRYRYAAENLAYLPLYDLSSRFRVVSKSQCQFVSASGRRLGRHTYQSLAVRVVEMWMNSPGHRRNLLSQRTTHLSTAAAYQPRSGFCGDIYVTQIFVG